MKCECLDRVRQHFHRFRVSSFLPRILILRFDLYLLLIVPRFFFSFTKFVCNIGGCVLCLGYKWHINTYLCLTLECLGGISVHHIIFSSDICHSSSLDEYI